MKLVTFPVYPLSNCLYGTIDWKILVVTLHACTRGSVRYRFLTMVFQPPTPIFGLAGIRQDTEIFVSCAIDPSEKLMTGAMKAVADGLLGINKAADEFGIPRSTLKDRLSGKVVDGTRSGPSPYLSSTEEDWGGGGGGFIPRSWDRMV